MSLSSWDETTINSDIFSELNDFLESTKNMGKEKTSELLKEKIIKAYKKNNIDLALLWLNEYQFINKNDIWSDEYEKKLAPLYDKQLAASNRTCSFFKKENLSLFDIEALKDRYAGERCFILGNGPSLNKVDLTKLKNEFTFGVNSIFLARDKMGFEPTFYCVEDTHVAKERKHEMQKVNSTIKFYGYYLKDCILAHTNNLFVNTLVDYRRYVGYPYFSIDASRRLWVGGTVSYINMQLAYYMGFKNVYLIGFDHEYTIPSSAIVKGDDILSTVDDPNHFHPNYFGKGYHWHIPLVNRMELCYIKAKRAFDLDNREIINITPGGQLNVFRRDNYDKVLSDSYAPNKSPEEIKSYVSSIIEKQQSRDIKISVIVPAYNVENYIANTINSIIYQSFKDVEIIIVNDGSTDSTLSIIEEYARNFDNIKVISQENKGAAGARNAGIHHAQGKYCTFVDADDVIKQDMLLNLYTAAEQAKADIVQCGYERVEKDKIIATYQASLNFSGYTAIQEMSIGHSFSAWAKLYRIDFFRKHDLLFEEYVYHEDIEFSLKAHYFSSQSITIPYIGYSWAIRKDSLTYGVKNKKGIEDISHICKNLKEFYIKENLFDKYHRSYYALCYRLFDLILLRIHSEPDMWNRVLLLRVFRKELEKNDLDFYEYIEVAQSICEYPQKIFEKVFLTKAEYKKRIQKNRDITLEQRYKKAPHWLKIISLLMLDRKRLKYNILQKHNKDHILSKLTKIIPD
ncbi:glycosyltransferase [Desulfovibrio litoralis]|uniref:Uncharacterized protein n=1 Tax=Desulfovibrio litoralis DSM 11393 TaxID=1121455 RepID=A0A1M7RSI5_9BACT|nr:glycosyltransferase [Desulfovibrio litoralis]SHN49048.1 Protein of unknown function DUF115 [Desulfovibrio litoralis DSM 11393]